LIDFSLAVFSVGFLTSVLGAMMVYISLRRGRDETAHAGTGILANPLEKVRNSKRLVKFIFLLGSAVTLILATATLLGLWKW